MSRRGGGKKKADDDRQQRSACGERGVSQSMSKESQAAGRERVVEQSNAPLRTRRQCYGRYFQHGDDGSGYTSAKCACRGNVWLCDDVARG